MISVPLYIYISHALRTFSAVRLNEMIGNGGVIFMNIFCNMQKCITSVTKQNKRE